MTYEDVQKLVNTCALPDTCDNSEIKETHISWIVLSDNYAFKIKRPVKFSFADFSTLEKRKYFCHREIELNRRLAPAMYLDVISLDLPESGNREFAVKMKRMDNAKEMDMMLKMEKISERHIQNLATKIGHFHSQAKPVKNTFDVNRMHNLYADISSVKAFAGRLLGMKWQNLISDCIANAEQFIQRNRNLFSQRVITGKIRDGHGDLNAKNIFLYDDPVIFDCIEFNDTFRQIDILNDIAFLVVDLDFYNKMDFTHLFYKNYLEITGEEQSNCTSNVLNYYKSYRANIRAKVTLLKAKENEDEPDAHALEDVKKYLSLMKQYQQKFLES